MDAKAHIRNLALEHGFDGVGFAAPDVSPRTQAGVT